MSMCLLASQQNASAIIIWHSISFPMDIYGLIIDRYRQHWFDSRYHREEASARKGFWGCFSACKAWVACHYERRLKRLGPQILLWVLMLLMLLMLLLLLLWWWWWRRRWWRLSFGCGEPTDYFFGCSRSGLSVWTSCSKRLFIKPSIPCVKDFNLGVLRNADVKGLCNYIMDNIGCRLSDGLQGQ